MVDAVDAVHIPGGDGVNRRQILRISALRKALANGPQERVRAEQPLDELTATMAPSGMRAAAAERVTKRVRGIDLFHLIGRRRCAYTRSLT